MDCSLAPKARQPASSQPVTRPLPSARVLQPTEQQTTSENSFLTLPLSPAEFKELKKQWLEEVKRFHRGHEDGFRYAAQTRLPSRLYEPLYQFSKEHDFSMSTSLQYAVYSLLQSHGI